MKDEEITPAPQLTTPELKAMKTAFLVGTFPSSMTRESCESNVQELERLCDTYGLQVIGRECCPYKKLDPGTYIGSGKVVEIKEKAAELKADVIIFDDEISPRQQKNLEKEMARPVIDRTELIIEVFAQRAQTREARLQIELAKVRYQIPRLKRLWTHLSRQSAGGGAYLKGEGEKQIEIDRRLLKRRIERLFSELKEVRAHRETQRAKRLRTGIPTFAIVGYTNAGKSTLLKALTAADVLVEDKLFATLDTKTKKFKLPNEQEILLIDTVGFIRKIPHTLVAAFRSTLEEAAHTDILLHLIDASSPNAEQQAEETMLVLKELKALDRPIITVLNKIDREGARERLYRLRTKYPKTVIISAVTGEGFSDLMELMQKELANLRQVVDLKIPQSHYALVSELTREGRIVSIEYEGNDILIKAEVPTQMMHKVVNFIVE